MPSLNWNQEYALEQTAGDKELLQELLSLFKTSFAADLKKIERAIKDNNPHDLATAAHSIKGAAASLGIEGVRSLALELEKKGLNGSLDALNGEITGLKELLPMVERLSSTWDSAKPE